MSPEIAEKIAAIGRVIDPAKTGAIYAPLHDREPYAGVTVARDIRYGPADRNRLDIFTADGASGTRPVLIFVHGGGFTGGDKSTPGSPFYDNVPLWAARNGLIGVNITYRLAPQAPWPAGAEDVGRGVALDDRQHRALRRRSVAASFCSDIRPAPPMPALMLRCRNSTNGGRGLGIAGLILTSGIYDLADFPLTDNYRSYIGSDASLYAERSPIGGLAHNCRCLSLLVYAELDPAPFIPQFEKLAAAMAKAPGGKPRTLKLDRHSHLSLGYAIGTDDTALTGPILDFVRSVK